ncbi:MAG: hypothetical protein GY847_36170 [Proteobacteria bacterium]|nr:hypothetical protein [Pseudomonadota bacterium]
MIEVETWVRVAIYDALNRKSRKPFYWGGLKGYEQLVAISKALGEISYDEPEMEYLGQLKKRVDRVVEMYRVNAEDLKEAHTWLRKIADCLRYPPSNFAPDPSLTGEQVRHEMDELLQSFQPDLKRKPAQAALHGAWHRIWEDYGSDLCQATIRKGHQRQLEMPMPRSHLSACRAAPGPPNRIRL